MKQTLRALIAVGLLVGFYVVAIGLAIGLVALVVEAAVLGANGAILLKVGLVAVVAAYAIFKGLLSGRKKVEEPGGMLLSEQDQPRLWGEVRALAGRVGTRVPDEIRLVAQVNAAVSEESKFLGLLPGRRRLYLGVPLLIGMDQGQVRAVLAHELGHYSGRHTALAAVSYRGKEAIARVLAELGPGSYLGKLLGFYGRLYYAVAHTVGRRQELEADEYSVQVAGRETAASALREQAPLVAAWDYFASAYASVGEESGRRPIDLFVGFAALLADPVTVEQMERIREEQPELPTSVYDTHPSMQQRIALIEAASGPQVAGDPAPALDLLVYQRVVLGMFEERLYEGSGRSPARWEEIVEQDAARQVAGSAGFFAANPGFVGTAPTMTAVLDRLAVPGGLGISDGATPEQERAFVANLLGDLAADVLVRRQTATFRLAWSGGLARLTTPDGTEIDPWAAAGLVATEQDASPFRTWADEHQVDLTAEIDVPEGEPAPPVIEVGSSQDTIIGVVAPVRYRGVRSLVVTRGGILLTHVPWGRRLAFGFRSYVGDAGSAMAGKVTRSTVEQLAAEARTIPYAWSQIASIHLEARRFRSSRVEISLNDGARVVLKFAGIAGLVGQPWDGIGGSLGPRFTANE